MRMTKRPTPRRYHQRLNTASAAGRGSVEVVLAGGAASTSEVALLLTSSIESAGLGETLLVALAAVG